MNERANLLSGVWKMIQAGPVRFLEEAKAASLTVQSLHEKNQRVPRCLDLIIHNLSSRNINRKFKDEDGTHPPRSRMAVMRMWARLQRKIKVLRK